MSTTFKAQQSVISEIGEGEVVWIRRGIVGVKYPGRKTIKEYYEGDLAREVKHATALARQKKK